LTQKGDRRVHRGGDDYVFVGIDGRYLDGSALRRRYRDAQATAKVPRSGFTI